MLRRVENSVNANSLSRRNLRDLTVVLSLGSALFLDASSTTVYIALGLLGLGCFIHVVSKGTLIRNTILCKEGIYGVVRHPYYLANYLVDWSFCLLSGNLLLFLLYPFLFFCAYGPTMTKEEDILFSKHGDSFTKSALEIPRVFPNINSLRNISTVFRGFSAKRITLKECSRTMKFCATGLLLVLIHEVKVDIVSGLHRILFPTVGDFDEFLFTFLLTVLYIASAITLAMSNRNKSIILVRDPSTLNIDADFSNHDQS
jgi:hypothetical protein